MFEKQQIVTENYEFEIGLRFVEANTDKLEDLNENLTQIAEQLEVPPYAPILPTKGFLSRPLSLQQSAELESILGHHYAKEGVKLQDSLASISIEESGERMIFLPKSFNNKNVPLSLSQVPFHEACGEWGGKPRIFWVRENISNKLLNAAQALSLIGVMFHVEDAFRPFGVQEGLFFRRVKLILNEHPEWVNAWDKVWEEARSKTAISPAMSGHKSGAALDLTLRTIDGGALPLGNKYPDGGSKVSIYFPYVTQEEWYTRQLFIGTMQMVGLQVYPFENWHASAGDLSGGIDTSTSTPSMKPDYKAIYGPIKGFDPETGKVEPYKIEEYYHAFFTKEELMQ